MLCVKRWMLNGYAQICEDMPRYVQIIKDLMGSVWKSQNVKQIVKLSQY